MVSCIVDRRVGRTSTLRPMAACSAAWIDKLCQKPAVRFTVAVAIATVNLKVADIIYQ